MTAVYLRNRSPTSALTDATPYEAWRGDKPDLSHLRVFGCRAYMHLDKTKRSSKLQPRSIPVIFVGYATEAKGWLVYNPVSSNQKTHVSRDVTFHESVAGSTLLTAAVSAAEPAEMSSTVSSSSTTLAAEPVDTGSLSSIDILLDTDTESNSEDEPEAAEPRAHQPISLSASTQPGAAQSLASGQAVAGESVVSDRRVTGQSLASGQPATAPPPAPQPESQSRKQRKSLSRQQRIQRQLASFNTPGRTEQTDEQQRAFAVQVGETIGEPRTYKEHLPARCPRQPAATTASWLWSTASARW